MAAREPQDIEGRGDDGSPPSNGPAGATQPAVLCLDGDLRVNDALADALRATGTEMHFATGWSHALRTDLALRYAAIFIDADARYEAPELHRLHLCKLLSAASDLHPVVVLHEPQDRDLATLAMRNGAFDVLPKPIDARAVLDVLERARLHARVERGLSVAAALSSDADASKGPSDTETLANEVWAPPALRRTAHRLARSRFADGHLLITGESGTGKAALAQLVHDLGERRDAPFCRVNCVGLSAPALEQALFGDPATGSFADGAMVRAEGGTLLVHLVDHMPLETQVMVLRALRDRRLERPNGDARPLDARIIATASERLEATVVSGEFLEPLYHRLNSSRAAVPPLREQLDDLPGMAAFLLRRPANRNGIAAPTPSLSAAAIEAMRAHTWPGNFRELENVLRRASAVCDGDTIEPHDLELERAIRRIPLRPRLTADLRGLDRRPDTNPTSEQFMGAFDEAFGGEAAPESAFDDLDASLDALFERWLRQRFPHRPLDEGEQLPAPGRVERAYLEAVVRAAGDSKSVAAMVLGMARRTLYRRLEDERRQKPEHAATSTDADASDDD